MSKIIRFSAENYMRLVAAEITPNGNIVMINGKNGAGKSSVLNAIAAALGGVNKKATPKPIREGAETAEIVLETEELIVTRRFTAKTSTLTVETHDGAKFTKGQAKLDDLLGKLSLDPFAFTQLDDKKQLETLLGLVDLPFDPQDLETQRKTLFDQRADVGRQSKAIGTVNWKESLLAEEESAAELIQSIRQAQQRNDAIRTFTDQMSTLEQRHAEIGEQVEALMRELSEVESRITAGNEWLQFNKIQETTELEDRLNTIEESNAEIRANNAERQKLIEQTDLDNEYEQLTEQIAELDQKKHDGLAAAEMPVDGLSFDDTGVTYQGIPFKQVNTASQIRVSFAMAMALNPKLRVVRIAEGSLLDDDNMTLIADMANEHDYQVWIERVGTGDGTGIIIEDGAVANA